jgi:membrane peptidoglycan carboxypeptidase
MTRIAAAELAKKILRCVLPRRWLLDNLWIRVDFIRTIILAASLHAEGIDLSGQTREKISAINEFIKSVLADPDSRRYFAQDSRSETDRKQPPSWRARHLFPTQDFFDMLIGYLLCFEIQIEERYFKLDDLITIESQLLAHEKKRGHTAEVFVNRKSFSAFFKDEEMAAAVPESYLVHFFPLFDPNEFLTNRAPFELGRRKFFLPVEMERIVVFFRQRMRVKNPSNPFQRLIPAFKAFLLTAVIVWYSSLFLFDLGMLVYGFSKNDYFYTLPGLGRVIESYDSPYARRAARIFLRNGESKFEDFTFDGSPPAMWNNYRVNKNAQVAVELNYDSYKALRVHDQSGLTLIAVSLDKIQGLAKTDRKRFNRLMDIVVNKRWWEKSLSFIDRAAGNSLNLLDYTDIPAKRIFEGVSHAVMESPTPLSWIRSVNEICDCITPLYYKANSMKWTDIGEVPPVMIRAVVLREDRRFYNDFFPVPHRGNDNLVIVPQIAKRLARAFLEYTRSVAVRYGLSWLERRCRRTEEWFGASFRDESRGGSSISNQVMEMLYTKYIITLSDEESFTEKQVDQKEHELPASLAVDWFWSEENILEAYVNEVYGGHLNSDIRGLRSEAEIYFMKELKELNLREQILLVAAIKKPSRIKEYAQMLKAVELKSLLEKKGAGRDAISRWERENAEYRVDRSNVGVVLASREGARNWLEKRLNGILRLLYEDGEISSDEYLNARYREKIEFNFAPGTSSIDNRLINNIKREIDRELGPDRSDSGIVAVVTINMEMQRKLQGVIDRHSKRIRVDPGYLVNGQPDTILLEGGARIVLANEKTLSAEPRVVNKILADVGGASRIQDEWDWVTMANRSLGSSLKPVLDLYFILMGYNLQDEFKNTRVTYKTYSLEQRRIYQNYIHKFPGRLKEIENIEKYWTWSPKNITRHTEKWISVKEALVRSVNSVHVQIQELVTPGVFARLLNEMMGITGQDGEHQPFRSIILGGSNGDQRYDKFLQAYSIFPNLGVLKRQTLLETVLLPDGMVLMPDYRPIRSPLLEQYGDERVKAACLLINLALRDIVKQGTMHPMDGIGAGKTGTSNDFRDALATVHFIAGERTYIAGVRLGNRHNYSLGEAADMLAVPLLHEIVTGIFERSRIMKDGDFDEYLKRLASRSGEIVSANGQYILKGSGHRVRMLDVHNIQEEKRKEYLKTADTKFFREHYAEAARYYEMFLKLARKFDSNEPAFDRMIRSYLELGYLKRARQLIERFSAPGMIGRIARAYGRKYNVRIKVDKDFYSGDNEYERKKATMKKGRHTKNKAHERVKKEGKASSCIPLSGNACMRA